MPHQIIALGDEVGDVLAVEEAVLEAHEAADAEDDDDVDQPELEGGLGLLLALLYLLGLLPEAEGKRESMMERWRVRESG